ncbi:MAG: GntR family transcriptional regulator, partial [Pseudomonadota bacterium]|nr:GntR family transcriptional regulator [Pseudomonadota bacterium]
MPAGLKRKAGDKTAAPEGLGFRPLYRQAKDVLVGRIATGAWQPGQILPSEFEIAADLGVSQGTVRKALDEMTAENLLVRRQGRGTFVARHDEERILFQFFKLTRDDGVRRFPESRVLDVRVVRASPEARARLGLAASDKVVQIERVRSLAGVTCVAEGMVLPQKLFPGIEGRDLPNNLYELYAVEFGVTVARANERLKAVAATARTAKHLDIPPG